MVNALLFWYREGLQGLCEAKAHYVNLSRILAVTPAIAGQVAKPREAATTGDAVGADHSDKVVGDGGAAGVRA